MSTKVIKQIYEQCRDSRDEHGRAVISAKDCAKLIRARLAAKFPGVKFSVRSDHNCVDVRWVDYPPGKEVLEIIDEYKFGGFDGMIDLEYIADNWLHPDGSMSPAACRGTVGSMGTVPAFATDCPVPGAVLVKYGPKYVFGHHEHTKPIQRRAAEIVLERFGDVYDESKNPIDQCTADGEPMYSHVMGRYWNEAIEQAVLESRGAAV